MNAALPLCVCLVLWPAGVWAQASPPATSNRFTLAEALAAMRAQHPLLAAAGSDVRAAEGDAAAASLWTNPVASAGWTPALHHSSYDSAGYFSFGVSQFIELGGVPVARGKASQALAQAARSTRADVERGLALDLEAAMMHWVASQRRLAIAEQICSMLAEVARVVEERVSAGASPRYDATRIEAAVALAQADRDSALADVSRAAGDFAAALGPGITRLHGEADYPLDEPYPLTDLARLEAGLTKRPDIRAANQRADSANAAASVARRSVFPGVNVQLSGGYGANPGEVDVGVGVALPLPVVDRGQGSIPAALGRFESARTLASGLQQLETLRLRGLWAEAQQRRDALAKFRAVAPSASMDVLAEARAGYVNGRFSVLELADAYASWRDIRGREVDLVEATRQSELEVARVAGLQR